MTINLDTPLVWNLGLSRVKLKVQGPVLRYKNGPNEV